MSIVFYAPRESNCGVAFDLYTPELLRKYPDRIWVFGDNLLRAGNGGQAIIRNEPNAIGLVTKRLPSHTQEAYMTGSDSDYAAVDSDFSIIQQFLDSGSIVIFPAGGLGTGLSRLQIHAPKLLSYIDSRVSTLIKTNYEMVRKFIR